MESQHSQEDYDMDNSPEDTNIGKSEEKSVLDDGKDGDSVISELSNISEANTNQNSSIHIDSSESKDTSPLSESVSFPEDGKEMARETNQQSESSDENEEDMPRLIDNENVAKNDNEKLDSQKKVLIDQNRNNDSSPQGSNNPDLQKETIDPEHVKENDVEDECLHEVDKEKKEEDEYLDILGNGSLKKKVMCCINILHIWYYMYIKDFKIQTHFLKFRITLSFNYFFFIKIANYNEWHLHI